MLGSLITFVALMFDFMTVSYQQIEAQDLWPACIQIRGKGAYETIAPRRMHRTDARQFFEVLLSPPVANLTIDPIQLPWFEKNSCYSALSSLRPVSFGFLCAEANLFAPAASSVDHWPERFPSSSHRSFPLRGSHTVSPDVAAVSPPASVRVVHPVGASCCCPGSGEGRTLNESRAQVERQDKQRDAEYQRIGAKPPGQHDRPDQRCRNHQDTIDQRGYATEKE